MGCHVASWCNRRLVDVTINICLFFVRSPSDFRPMTIPSYLLSYCILRPTVLRTAVLRLDVLCLIILLSWCPAPCYTTSCRIASWRPVPCRFVQRSSNFRLTFVWPLFDVRPLPFIPVIAPYSQTVHYVRIW